jgi:hypothetical protein
VLLAGWWGRECQTRWLACVGMKAGVAGEWSTAVLPRPVTSSGMAEPALAVGQLVARAASPGFDGTAGPAAYDDPLQMVVEWSLCGWGTGARLIVIWPSRLRCGHVSIAAWPATPTAMTWARDAHRNYLAAV